MLLYWYLENLRNRYYIGYKWLSRNGAYFQEETQQGYTYAAKGRFNNSKDFTIQ